MGRTLEVDWQETASELKKQYRKERNSERKTRLQAFWQLRLGKTLKEVVELIGISYRTLQRWIAWYRQGGLKEVLRRIKGHGNQGRPTKLNAIQQKALAIKTALGSFRNIWDAIQWVSDRWKVQYSYSGLFKRLKRLKCRLKVPRPCSVKADVEAQNEWKATGLTEALREAEMTTSSNICFSDEMRFGLWGQTRKRWGLQGVPIIQPIQIEFEWQYLVLAIDVMRCKLYWAWADRMNQACLIPIFSQWVPDAVIWDGASAHRGKAMGEVGFDRIFLLPYSPELNPCERVFEWLSRDTSRLKHLISWKWIQEAFTQLTAASIPEILH